MDSSAIILIGGVVIGLIVVVAVVACCFVLKKQKQVNGDYMKTGAAERKILENNTYNYSEVINTPEFSAMITRFPGLLPQQEKVYPGNVIITKNWVKMIQVNSVEKTYVNNNAFGFITRQVVIDETNHTKVDVAKSAAAGAVIAGAAGAVVAAIHATEVNDKGGIEHHNLTDTDRYRVAFMANVPSAGGVPEKQYVSCDGILLSNSLMKKLNAEPEVMACIPKINGNYIQMPGIVSHCVSKQQAETIAKWLNANIIA